MPTRSSKDQRLEALARLAGELLVRRGSHPDVLVARGRFGQAIIDGTPLTAIDKRLKELVDVIRLEPEVARLWSYRAISRIELYAVADALALGAETYPSREELEGTLSLIRRGDFVKAISDEADAVRFRALVAPGQTWLRWDEVAGQQAEILRGIAKEEWRRADRALNSPKARRDRLRLMTSKGDPPNDPAS